MKFRVGDIVEYINNDLTKLRGSIGIVKSRSALMITVDWISQSRDVHPQYDVRIPTTMWWAKESYKYTFEDKHFSKIVNVKEATWQAEISPQSQ